MIAEIIRHHVERLGRGIGRPAKMDGPLRLFQVWRKDDDRKQADGLVAAADAIEAVRIFSDAHPCRLAEKASYRVTDLGDAATWIKARRAEVAREN